MLQRALKLLIVTLFGAVVLSARVGLGSDDDQKERRKAIEKLLAMVRDEKLRASNKRVVHEAILTLGLLKAEEAIPDLVDLLTFTMYDDRDGGPRTGSPPVPSEIYPAVKAVKDIGKPAARFLLKAIGEKGRSEKYARNAQYLYLSAIGSRGEAETALRDAIEAEKDEANAKRLKAFKARFNFKTEKTKDGRNK